MFCNTSASRFVGLNTGYQVAGGFRVEKDVMQGSVISTEEQGLCEKSLDYDWVAVKEL